MRLCRCVRMPLLSICLVWASVGVRTGVSSGQEGPYLANGIKIGDITSTSVEIWSRLGKTRSYDSETFQIPPAAGELQLVLADPKSDQPLVKWPWQAVSDQRDGTWQWSIDDLQPNQNYRFTVTARNAAGEETDSVSGQFRTAPDPSTVQSVSFAVMTCQKFNVLDDGPAGYRTYRSLMKFKPDFASHTGDAVYYDQPPLLAKNMTDARAHWHRMYSLPNLKQFHANTPVFMIKDDHDTLKDDCWSGQSYGDLTFEQGVAIHREQNPIGKLPYRTLRWGRDLQVWFVEGREYRTPNKMKDGPDKTILGKQQKQWLQRTLSESDATFKFLISATPIVGPDRDKKNDNHANQGFSHEGNWLRQLLAEHDVITINGDRHWQYVSVDPDSGLWEFGTGPVLDARAQGWKPSDRRDEHRFLRVKGGFLRVELEPNAETVGAKITHHDVDGNAVHAESFSRARE